MAGDLNRLSAGYVVVESHALDLGDLPEKNPKFGRFYGEAPSHGIYGLLTALKLEPAEEFTRERGRRVLVIGTRRGAGKGHFFAAVQGAGKGGFLDEMLELLSGGEGEAAFSPLQSTRWGAVAFFNLSFAHEVMSVFDKIAILLYRRLKSSAGGAAGLEGWNSLKNDRIERLNFILKAWARPTVNPRQRVLIAINSFEVLLDREGLPKNGEVRQIVEALTHEDVASAPIDFVLTIDERRVPQSIRSARYRNLPGPTLLLGHPIDEKRRNLEKVRFERLCNSGARDAKQVAPLSDASSSQTPASGRAKGAIAVHFLHGERAIVLAAAYFPRVALLIARSILMTSSFARLLPQTRKCGYPSIYYHDDNALGFRQKIGTILRGDRPDGQLPPRDFIPAAIMFVALALEHQEEKLAAPILPEDLLSELKNRLSEQREVWWKSETIVKEVVKLLRDKYHDTFSDNADSTKKLLNAVETFDDRFRQIYEAAGAGRFAMTLLLAGAYEITTDLTWAEPENHTIPIEKVGSAAQRVERFLERVEYGLQGVSERDRTSAIIEQVVSLMSRHHAREAELPLRLRLRYMPKWSGEDRRILGGWKRVTQSNSQMFDLLMEIIWHLAIIGQPVELEVLVNCPRIQDAADALSRSLGNPDVKLKKTKELDLFDSDYIIRQKVVAELLGLGVNRCLIFPLKSVVNVRENPTCRYDPDEDASRYTVHRLMQRYVFEQMGAPGVEYSEHDQFTVSLFASQPNDLPRLTPEAHTRIRKTIAELAGFPDPRARPGTGSTMADKVRRARMLRAAYGIMRSVYSVGVLARFDTRLDPNLTDTSGVGHFEDYRKLVLWVLKATVDLQLEPADKADSKDLQRLTTSGYASEGEDGRLAIAPFYAEEIVWLYNECGVLSLVQGHLADAHALFGRAFAAAVRIEPEETRPLHLRIGLNKALVDIERGHPAEARRHLERILSMKEHEDEVLPLLAQGYLGLIEHLAGNSGVAEKRYRDAIDELINRKQSRAASIFLKHQSDLLRGVGKTDDARKCIDQALNFAQEGCHEDVRHIALLSRAKLLINCEPAKASEIYGCLDEAERYADVVGMPRLSCEAAELRARLLLRQGETRLASSLASRSIEIAATNDLRIRKMNALLLLADICIARGERHTARPLIELGWRIAKSAEAHFALTGIQRAEESAGARRRSVAGTTLRQ